MPRTTPDDGDTWVGVKDPKKRKQIQDRLAQRARRRRLAGLKAASSSDSTTKSALLSAKIKVARDNNTRALPSPPNSAELAKIVPISSPLDVYSALWNNGTLLGLTCGSMMPALSKDLGPSIPEFLRPTALQQMTLHPPWIDRFPFPTMRDNFIVLLGVIDSEDFLRDMFTIPSFTVKCGGPSWDPLCWSIEKGFAMKWGFLFNPRLLEFAHDSAAPAPSSPASTAAAVATTTMTAPGTVLAPALQATVN